MKKINKIYIILSILLGLDIIFIAIAPINKNDVSNIKNSVSLDNDEDTISKPSSEIFQAHPMAIESLRNGKYPGGDFVIEEKLSNGTNYSQYIASYQSEGLKIYGLLTVPLADKPSGGWPAIIFIHGYIQPDLYSTTGNYPTYQAYLARSGFVTFKPDLRGHGDSEGEPVSAHFSEKYVVDTLYAISYLKNYPEINPDRIGYWGHSNGGEIGLRTILVSPDIKAASLWAGVVGSYPDMLETYNYKINFLRNATSSELVMTHGLPSENPTFWDSLDPYTFLDDIDIPIELQHGTKDESVPIELSLSLKSALEKLNKTVIYYEYDGDNHNISNNVSLAFDRTIDFYKKNLKIKSELVFPVAEFKERITKKSFGTYVTPDNSPVTPERFKGYHTGVDVEYDDTTTDVPVSAISDGIVVFSGTVNGYGGLVVIQHTIDDKDYLVFYGHLAPGSLIIQDSDVLVGQQIGVLGKAYSTETDGERRHLHLAVYTDIYINMLGYVQNKEDLSKWIDPMLLFD